MKYREDETINNAIELTSKMNEIRTISNWIILNKNSNVFDSARNYEDNVISVNNVRHKNPQLTSCLETVVSYMHTFL